MFVDPSGNDAIVITADNAAGSSGIYAGHTSVIVQDSKGEWYYYYWGDEAAYCVHVPKAKMDSLANFNTWISSQVKNGTLKNSTTGYTDATYICGDFSKTKDYYADLIKNTTITEETITTSISYFSFSKTFYENKEYSLFTNNCVTTSIDGLKKGVMANGKSYAEVIPTEPIIPKVYEWTVKILIGNSSFTKP